MEMTERTEKKFQTVRSQRSVRSPAPARGRHSRRTRSPTGKPVTKLKHAPSAPFRLREKTIWLGLAEQTQDRCIDRNFAALAPKTLHVSNGGICIKLLI